MLWLIEEQVLDCRTAATARAVIADRRMITAAAARRATAVGRCVVVG